MATFDELFEHHTLTPEERKLLVWHLAALRARRTVEALLPAALSGASATPEGE